MAQNAIRSDRLDGDSIKIAPAETMAELLFALAALIRDHVVHSTSDSCKRLWGRSGGVGVAASGW
jgi:hypothetical protein